MATAEDIAKALGTLAAHDEQSTVKHFLDTGFPPLNHALASRWDGGLPVGRVIEIYGPESSGKTAIATMAMISAQRMGGYAGFNDHERSFQQYLAEMMGLDPHPGRFAYKKPKTFEDSIAICIQTAATLRDKKLISADAPIAWVFDSLAFMVPDSAFYDQKTGAVKAPGQRSMHDNTALARATSAHFPAFAQHCDDLGICAIFLNQIRMNIGVVYGNPETTPGGKTPKYVFSQRISLGASKIVKGKGADAEVLGSEITAKIVKNKVARPFHAAKWRFEFQEDGTGKFNIVRSMIEFLVEEKILPTSGGWIEWEGKKYYASVLAEKLENEPDGLDKLKALLPKAYEPPVVAVVAAGDETGEVGVLEEAA